MRMSGISSNIPARSQLLVLNILYLFFYVGALCYFISEDVRVSLLFDRIVIDVLGAYLFFHTFLVLGCITRRTVVLQSWFLLAVLETISSMALFVITAVKCFQHHNHLGGWLYVIGSITYPVVKMFHIFLVHLVLKEISEDDSRRDETGPNYHDNYI